MAITRSGHDARAATATATSSSAATSDGQQQPPPPPPPQQPPTWQQLYATQTEILRNLQHQQQMMQQQMLQQGGQRAPQPQVARYEDFLVTHPPIFSRADEPLEADTWSRAIESKFTILATPCTANRKVVFAAQQLRGPALLWWENYLALQQEASIDPRPPAKSREFWLYVRSCVVCSRFVQMEGIAGAIRQARAKQSRPALPD
nr:unnamed protein product [Digitaria exilis]